MLLTIYLFIIGKECSWELFKKDKKILNKSNRVQLIMNSWGNLMVPLFHNIMQQNNLKKWEVV